MSEDAAHSLIQVGVRSLDQFADEDVVIDDWTIKDQSTLRSPYFIIHTSSNFVHREDVQTQEVRWEVPCTLVVRYQGWQNSLEEFRDHRQAIIDVLTGEKSSGDGIMIVEIRANSPIVGFSPEYNEPDQRDEEEPVFIEQDWIIEVLEF